MGIERRKGAQVTDLWAGETGGQRSQSQETWHKGKS